MARPQQISWTAVAAALLLLHRGPAASCKSAKARYTVASQGLTVKDEVTGLEWVRSPDTDGDGELTPADKLNYTAAQARCPALNEEKFAGHDDWRFPTIKELYSLMNFTGYDPPTNATSAAGLQPFVTTPPFGFTYGDVEAGERVLDAQYASATTYAADPKKVFGVNLADGRIKGYDSIRLPDGDPFMFFVICVRGTPEYGQNRMTDNGDGTVTDAATCLMWSKNDSGSGMPWRQALEYAQQANQEGYLSYDDWRLPTIKELHSITNYSRSPDTTGTPALAGELDATSFTNERGEKDWGFYWSGTTHVAYEDSGAGGGSTTAAKAAYVAIGRCLGYLSATSEGQDNDALGSAVKEGWYDVHGAGCQRSDPKSGDPSAYPKGDGPQGDAIRINNMA
ncbi:PQQ enzyme repeat [Chlorella sorokiniana]|uniref:PQQ enzyme repeat n=1 Tax=Chlorella sorokiniana TaxID=3076 RepID=A0A2P6TSS3_CHLSO|nr:PQQ enzyme repeat [Chlorella sorokiniana]|eukprot:PRW57120.1 PQQ enzyme repeat [Chlorella sorokiniana]